LEKRSGRTYNVDDDGGKNGCRYLGPVYRVFFAANEFGVVILEQKAEDGKNDDRKYRDDDAVDELEPPTSRKTRRGRVALTKTMLALRSQRASSWRRKQGASWDSAGEGKPL
jgi:hypothetical protein